MKKLTAIIMTLMLFCTCSVTALADEGKYNTANDLFQYWEEYAYPDYICGVWSTDGSQTNLTFAVQNNDIGEAGKKEILDLIENDSTVSFAYQKYSLNYLRGIMDELHPYFEDVENGTKLGFVSMGIYQQENHLQLDILEDKKNQEETIEFINMLTEKYGDALTIGYTEELVTAQDDMVNHLDQTVTYVGICVLLIVLCAFTFAIKKRNVLMTQTNTGGTAAATPLLTKEVEEIVKKSDVSIPSDLDAKIMAAIDKND